MVFAAGGAYAMHAPYRDLKRGTAEGVVEGTL